MPRMGFASPLARQLAVGGWEASEKRDVAFHAVTACVKPPIPAFPRTRGKGRYTDVSLPFRLR